MAASLTSFVALFSCSWIFVLCQEPQEVNVTVKPGENATLQCRGDRDADIRVIEWSRTDLKIDGSYVFYFGNGKTNKNYQHESFRGRVELRDPERTDGDASVILKNVNINDTGTYECWIIAFYIYRHRKRDLSGPICTIRLTVTGHTAGNIWEGNIGLIIRLTAVCVIFLLLVAVGVFMLNKQMQSRPRPEKTTPDSESAEDSLNPSS